MGIRVEGGQRLAQALRALPLRVGRSVLREALYEAAEPMRQRASDLAPVAPGAPDLAQNIGISNAKAETIGEQVAAVAVGPTKGFFYGFYQEYGTRHHGAQPFLRPAFDTQAEQSIAKLQQTLWRALSGASPSAGSRNL